ncbi:MULTISPECIES: 3,4-dihydroxy-2-butanone-4-phosphate synthase [Actinomycetes]|uniref:3,4-dihydroxy-2-butanone-4-phosphate synthase n=1 Tax=Actinomycetes TaxID=1760 RepID=UPI00068EF4A7|nr:MULTISPECIES: 3,4-dihydroxy-2-butanone-4-phosphate synthase [Actinomycetes]
MDTAYTLSPSAPRRRTSTAHDSAGDRAHRLWSVLGELRAGRPVVLADDIGGTGCDLVTGAADASVGAVHRLVRWGSGFVCVTVDDDTCRRLELPPMSWLEAPGDYPGTMCVTVDAVAGTTTGISAADRATTARLLSDPAARPADFTRPGHVVPVRAGQFAPDRPERAAAAAALVGLAGVGPSAVFCALVSTLHVTEMASATEIIAEPDRAQAPVLSYSDLVAALDTQRSGAKGAVS